MTSAIQGTGVKPVPWMDTNQPSKGRRIEVLILIVKNEAAFASSMRAIRRMPDAFWQIAAGLTGADAADALAQPARMLKAASTGTDVFRNDTAFEEYRPD